jgi:hypothetical protein
VYGIREAWRDHQYMYSLQGNVHSLCICDKSSGEGFIDILFLLFFYIVYCAKIFVTDIGHLTHSGIDTEEFCEINNSSKRYFHYTDANRYLIIVRL